MSTSNSVAPWDESGADEPTEIAAFSEFSDFNAPDAVAQYDAEDAPVPPEKEPLIDEIASEFIGFWNVLVSKTNWEKGRVVHSWRTKLIEAGMPRRIYSDESIAQRIGNVSPQHVGRLRRVFERFGSVEPLPNLFWSHYQAALDWDDADEWLQKASAEKLSVAQTRIARWEKNGAKLAHKPKPEDIVDSEKDEDVNPYNDSDAASEDETPITPGRASIDVDDETEKKPKKKEKRNKQTDELGEYGGEEEPWEAAQETFTTPQVLEAIGNLEPLPQELAEAFEALKVAIMMNKIGGWTEVKPILVAQYLSELKRLLVSEENDKK